MNNSLELSDAVTLVVIVPETHADQVREAMGRAGAGKIGNYSSCSFSVKGWGRFMPEKEAQPFIGRKGILETVAEERIETRCNRECIGDVMEAIRRVHPYEEPLIDLYPIYQFHQEITRVKQEK